MISISVNLSRDFGQSAVYSVQTSKTFYQVVVGELEARVIGPGVDESYAIGPDGEDDISDSLSKEGQALVAVILWEETE